LIEKFLQFSGLPLDKFCSKNLLELPPNVLRIFFFGFRLSKESEEEFNF